MKMVLAIGLGGAIGAISRHFMAHRVALIAGHGFPWGTLAVNILGSFAMGLLVTLLAQRYAPSQEVRGFLVVGLLGGFTTFSAFSMEAALLIERNTLGLAALYVGASVMLAISGLFAGIWAARALV